MPIPSVTEWPTRKELLYAHGLRVVGAFCVRNGLPVPTVAVVERNDWYFDACAFYRPGGVQMQGFTDGINICLEHCGRPCGDEYGRNWTWPGNVTDREPFGVLCHELGHHVDWSAGSRKGRYFSDYGESVMDEAGEKGLTGYADENPAEWFAEAFRLFVTNPDLLRSVRPRTYGILADRWTPVETQPWRTVLGRNCPERVVKSLLNKGAK